MFNLLRALKPWREAASLSAHVNLYGFFNQVSFLTKSGDVGMILRVAGVDYESLDHAAQAYAVKRLESALKAFGPRFHVYQYLFKANQPQIPFRNYDDSVVQTAVEWRRRFFERKASDLYEIEIYYCILLEGERPRTGIRNALAQSVRDPSAAMRELRRQFSNRGMRSLLQSQLQQQFLQLDQHARAFLHQLADIVHIEVLGQSEQLRFFRRLLNYDEWRIAGTPKDTQFLDQQVVNSDIEAERDHLRVGDRFVRVLTMKEAPAETRPLVLDALLKLPESFCAVTEWTPLPADAARRQVNKRRRHFNLAKTGFVSQLANDPARTSARDVLVDEAKQDDIETLGDCLRALGDGQQLGEFSLTLVLHGKERQEVERLTGEFAGIFTNADGSLFLETYNQLNAFFATIPGNYAFNLRRMLLLNSNYADLSFLFTIHPGEKVNSFLGNEYLAVLETDNQTPYYLNLHSGEVPHTLILGQTGSGKTFLSVFLAQNAQKYRPQTYIFDVGGSYESLTRIFGGTYLDVGRESRAFTINPFALPGTPENLQFLFAFVRVLIEGRNQRCRLDFKEEQKLWNAIERIYLLEPAQRTLTNLASIVGELKDRLYRWTRSGQCGFLFDNTQDTLSFHPFQTFNFSDWADSPELLEPLLFYILHRASNQITDPAQLGTFKMFLLDEAWLFFQNETVRNYVVQAQRTWRKHRAAMVLATQSLQELESSGLLPIVSECCPTKIFLANPGMNRAVYSEVFHLNDTELDLVGGLVPPGQMLIRKSESSKKVHLHVDAVSYWIATNNANDNLKKRDYFARFGFAEGLQRLAQEFPPNTHSASVLTSIAPGVAS